MIGLLVVFGAYCGFVLLPILAGTFSGHEFGGDIGSYLLTSHELFTGSVRSDHYVFPVLPVLYLPLSALGVDFSTSYAVADVVSGLLTIALVAGVGFLGYSLRRSLTAAIASGGVVGTFFLTLSEIGWGAQAQTLAFAIGSTAIAFLVREGPRPRRFRVMLLVGGLLGIAVLTESYAATYFVLFGVVLLATELGRDLFSWTAARTHWPVVVVPAAALSFVSAWGGAAASSVVTDPVLTHVLSVHAWLAVFPEIDFGNVADAYACGVLLAALVVFLLLGKGSSRKAYPVATGAIVAFALQAFLVTPAVYWDRAPYFLAFPLAVASAIMAPAALSTEPASPPLARERQRRVGHPARLHRWVSVAASVAVAGALLTQSVVAIETYPRVLDFYAVDAQALAGITWLRGESGGLLMVAPEGQTFPVEFASQRPVFPWAQPLWFDTPSERQAAILASMLVAGTRWIDAGGLKVVDSGFPSNASSPSVFGYEYPYLVNLLDVTETEGGVLATSETPASVGLGSERVEGAAGPSPSFTDNDSLPTFTVSKQTTVLSDGTVAVNLTLVSQHPPPHSVGVDLQFPQAQLAQLRSSTNETELTFSFGMSGSTTVRFESTVFLGVAANTTLSYSGVSNLGGFPTLQWDVAPGPGFIGSRLDVTIRVGIEGIGVAPPSLVTESATLASSGIGWVLLDKTAESAIQPRFSLDATFSLYWANDHYVVYRVVDPPD